MRWPVRAQRRRTRSGGRAAAATVQDVIVDQRRAVHQLDCDGGAQKPLGLGRRRAGGEEHQQRPQPLTAGRDGLAGVTAEQRAVPGGQLRHAQLKPVHQPRGRLPAGLTTASTAFILGRPRRAWR